MTVIKLCNFLLLSILTIVMVENGNANAIEIDSLKNVILDNNKKVTAITHSYPDSALQLVELSITLSSNISDYALLGRSNILKCRVLDKKYMHEEAFGILQNTQQLYEDNQDTVGIIRCYIERAKIEDNLGKFVNAQKNFDVAHKIAVNYRDTSQILSAINNLGIFYDNTENYTFSIEMYFKYLNLAKKKNDTIEMHSAYNNIANIYLKIEDFSKALLYYNKIYDYGVKNPDSKFKYLSLINLANFSNLINEDEEAIEYGERALVAIEQFNQDELLKSLVHYTLMEVYRKQENHSKTKIYLDKICEISEKYNSLNIKFNCYYGSLNYYKEIKDYQKAFFYSEKYHELNDSIFNPKISSKIANYKVNQDLEEKEKEITHLQQLSELLSERINFTILLASFFSLLSLSAFLIIKYRNREKQAIQQRKITESKLTVMQSQMNPHFIFNAFTAVQNFILKSNKIEAYKYLNKLASLLRQIVSITNNTYIKLDKEITFLQDYLELEKIRFRDNIEYTFIIDKELNSANPLIPSMMIQPHIENAIIHGLSDLAWKGMLIIKFEKFKGGLKCTIKDNGRGRFEAEKIKKNGLNKHLNVASINTNKRLSFLKEIGYNQAKVIINDLVDSNVSLGTEVIIYLPFINHKPWD